MKKKILIFVSIIVLLFLALIFFIDPKSNDRVNVQTVYLPTLCEQIKNSDSLSYSGEIVKYTILPKFKDCSTFANSAYITGGVTAELPDPDKLTVEYTLDNYHYFIELRKTGDSNYSLLNAGAREYDAPFYDKEGRIPKP